MILNTLQEKSHTDITSTRSTSSVSSAEHAHRMNCHVGRKSRKLRARSAQLEPLVLKVRFPPAEGKISSGDRRASAGPSQPSSEMLPTCTVAGSSAQNLHSDGIAQTLMDNNSPVGCVSSDISTEMQPTIRCLDNDPAGRFDWVLN